MRKTVRFALLLSFAALLVCGASLADDKKADAVDEKALMEAMIKAGTPGEHHKRLGALAGSWDVTVKMWMDPSKDPTESKATSESKLIMGGRFLEEKVTGDFGDMKFHGQGLTGYDNLQKKYTSAWIDNMGTGIETSTGSYDADTKTFTYHGEKIDALTGKKLKTKSAIHLIDKDKYEIDMYKVIGDKDVKEIHIDAVRKAAK
ncbi:MAG TPA: DUF1579 domain-containing protein [Gemmataceae bacterium]|nr:DUF1579 domain-containing protein [Gemmataceae bacterium]